MIIPFTRFPAVNNILSDPIKEARIAEQILANLAISFLFYFL